MFNRTTAWILVAALAVPVPAYADIGADSDYFIRAFREN